MNDAKIRTLTASASPWLTALAASGLLAAACWISPATGGAVGITLVMAFTWRVMRLRRRMYDLQNRDPLTGTANHAGLLDTLRGAACRCRADGLPLSVAILDCDCLKRVNDTFGHCRGDEVLKQTADVLRKVTGTRGTVARLWGDCFGIVLPALAFEEVRQLLDDVRRGLQAPAAMREWPVTLSIGSVTFDAAPADPRGLIPAAERLMYAVKHNGKDGVMCRRMAAGRMIENDAPTGGGRPMPADERKTPALVLSSST
jgi:diguanylate cyclase (GGDEF)-like protein